MASSSPLSCLCERVLLRHKRVRILRDMCRCHLNKIILSAIINHYSLRAFLSSRATSFVASVLDSRNALSTFRSFLGLVSR